MRQATERLDEEHHRRDAGARNLGRIVQRTARQAVRASGHLSDRLVGEFDEALIEQDRLDVPDPVPLDLDLLLAREVLGRPLRLLEHGRQLGRVEMTLVEEAFSRLDDRRDDARLRDDTAHRADRALPGALGDLPDLELESRGTGEGIATLVHRRRARVGRLTAEGHLMPLHAERPQDDAQG